MKLLDYLMELPFGEVVNKRALAVFKRLGYIYDYSPWGYLENVHISYKWSDGYRDHTLYEVFSNRNAKEAENDDTVYEHDEYRDKYGFNSEFEYKGMFFRTQYLSGCFKPYLIKVEPPTKRLANGKLVPKKKLYYRGYKCAFKLVGSHDKIYEQALNLYHGLDHRHHVKYGKAWSYAVHKTCIKGLAHRERKPASVSHGMVLWGAIC